MCTLSYFLRPSGEMILTSNRDETLQRGVATFPQIIERRGKNILAPIDPLGGGSWFGVTDKGIAGCLLNGAFGKHVPDPPYKHSRGLVLLDALTFDSAKDFIDNYDLNNIEPFTMVLFNYTKGPQIEEIKWDGSNIHKSHIEKGLPHVWSSPMMYPEPVQKRTEESYMDFIKADPDPGINDLYKFNFSESYERKTKLHNLEKIPILGTISISTILISSKIIRYIYRDISYKAESDIKLYK